jgi:hypothetical protein
MVPVLIEPAHASGIEPDAAVKSRLVDISEIEP